ATNGLSFYETGSSFRAVNGDVNASSIVFNILGDAPEPTGIIEDFVRIADGTVNVSGSFTFATPGQLSTLVNNGALNAGAVGLSAGTFVADTVITAPTNIGTINADAIGLFSNGNIIVTANLVANSSFTSVATGNVTLGNITTGGVIGISGGSLALGNLSSGNHINLTSTIGAITAGSVTAANFIAMTAANGLTLGLATATSGHIDLLVLAGNLVIGNVTAGTFIELEADAGTIQFGNANAGQYFDALASGNLTGGNVTALGAPSDTSYSVALNSGGGNITVGNLSGPRNIGMLAAGDITTGSMTSGEDVLVLGVGNIQINGSVTTATGANRFFYVGNASMASLLGPDFSPAPVFAVAPVRTVGSLTVTGPIQAGNVIIGAGTAFTAGGAINASGGRVAITANSINAQAVTASQTTLLNATSGNLTVGDVTSGGQTTLLANMGQITAGALAGAIVNVDGQGPVSIGGITTTGAINLRSVGSTFTSTGAITAATVAIGGVGVTLGNVTSTSGQIGIAAGTGNLAFGDLTSATFTEFSTGGSVNGGNITAGTSIGTIVGGNLTLGNVRSNGISRTSGGFSIALGATGNIQVGSVNSFGSLGIGSDAGSVTTGAVVAGDGAFIRANTSVTTGQINSTGNIVVRGGTNITTANLTATGHVTAASLNGSLTAGAISAGTDVLLLANQNIATGAISGATGAGRFVYLGNSSIFPATALLTSIDPLAIVTAQPLARTLGNITVTGNVTTGAFIAGAGQTLTLGNVNALAGQIDLFAGAISAGTLSATGFIDIEAVTGGVTAGNLVAGDFILIDAAGSVGLGNVTSSQDVDIEAGGSVSVGVGSSALEFVIDAGGPITTGDITSLGRSSDSLYSIGLNARSGGLTTGNLNGASNVGLIAQTGSVATGSITTGANAIILAGTSVGINGPVTTGTSATNFTYIANSAMAAMLGADFNPAPLFTATPQRVTGAINLGGAVTTGNLVAATTQGFSASGAITAGTRITIDAGGTAVFGGLAAAPTISVRSSDIALSSAGGLGNASTGSLTLTNSGDGLMIIGGTQSGTGYTLDASEIARLRAGNIVISSPSAGSSGTGIEIRSFTLNGSAASSGNNLNGSEGSLSIQTPGNIRVTGNAIFNGMAAANRVALAGQRVEIAADTGSLILNGSSPGGILSITANNIHIASASILSQLADNINFAGRDAALAQALVPSRPEGVIQASRLLFNVRDTLLIQNSGTSALFAGFLGRVGNVEITPSGSSGSSLDMVIYGQLLDTGDMVRNNSSVRNLIFPTAPTSGFTATSSINGCVLSAATCGSVGSPPSSGGDPSLPDSPAVAGPTAVAHAGPPPPSST
ncbi:beta strand repeat-containing protein, partial [Blastomonas sp.]|uniref:beta strand repeat-containing protein n=1 Tax=Blastomonas sp. TaxID=1909299 RepID=UPI0035941F56